MSTPYMSTPSPTSTPPEPALPPAGLPPYQPIPPAIIAVINLVVSMTSKSWKTTLAAGIGAFLFIYPQIQPLLAGQHVSKRDVLIGVCIGLMGYFARDKNVSSEMQSAVPGAKMPETPKP